MHTYEIDQRNIWIIVSYLQISSPFVVGLCIFNNDNWNYIQSEEDDEELLDTEGATEATEAELVQPLADITLNDSKPQQEAKPGNFEDINLLGDF